MSEELQREKEPKAALDSQNPCWEIQDLAIPAPQQGQYSPLLQVQPALSWDSLTAAVREMG